MFHKAIVLFGIIGVVLSLILGLFSVIIWQVVAILVAILLGIPSLVLTYEKLKPEGTAKPKEGKKEQEQGLTLEKKDTLREETILVSPNELGYYYEFELVKDDHLKGEIGSTEPIDIYFVDSINFDKWDRGLVSWDSEDCNEAVLETKIDYLAPKKGTWYLLIENNGRKTARVRVHLY